MYDNDSRELGIRIETKWCKVSQIGSSWETPADSPTDPTLPAQFKEEKLFPIKSTQTIFRGNKVHTSGFVSLLSLVYTPIPLPRLIWPLLLYKPCLNLFLLCIPVYLWCGNFGHCRRHPLRGDRWAARQPDTDHFLHKKVDGENSLTGLDRQGRGGLPLYFALRQGWSTRKSLNWLQSGSRRGSWGSWGVKVARQSWKGGDG
jgi:hypothetical protein